MLHCHRRGREIHITVQCLVTLVTVAACASSHPVPATEPAANARSAAVTTIMREFSFEDPELTSRNRGHLEIVVRSTDRPTQALGAALILVRLSARDTLRRMTDEQGVARFDSLPAGDHEVTVRRIGYGVARAIVPIKPGCRTDAEVYIAVLMIGLGPPPPMPARVTITTCR